MTAIQDVTGDEPFFRGHFPGRPVMPGVLVVEAMAQAGSLIVYLSKPEFRGKLIYFMGLDKCKFRGPVYPGDQVRYEIEVTRLKRVCALDARAFVDEKLVCEAFLRAMVVDDKQQERAQS